MADEYESQYMSEGRVVARDKLVAGKGMRIGMLIPLVLFALVTIAGVVGWMAGAPLLALAFAGAPLSVMFLFMFLTGSVLRTAVSDSELWVQGGLVGTRVPLDAIKTVRVGEQKNRIRIGKRFEDGYWTTSYLLRTGRYVEVIWSKGGKDRRLLFSPQDPETIVKAVTRARGLRIDTADEPALEEDLGEDEVHEKLRDRR